MKSIFQWESKANARTRNKNPLTHPEAFQPHFHKFYIYTGPEGDKDGPQSDTDQDTSNRLSNCQALHLDSDSDLGMDSDVDSDSDPNDTQKNRATMISNNIPTSFSGKDQLPPTIQNAKKLQKIWKRFSTPPELLDKDTWRNLILIHMFVPSWRQWKQCSTCTPIWNHLHMMVGSLHFSRWPYHWIVVHAVQSSCASSIDNLSATALFSQ